MNTLPTHLAIMLFIPLSPPWLASSTPLSLRLFLCSSPPPLPLLSLCLQACGKEEKLEIMEIMKASGHGVLASISGDSIAGAALQLAVVKGKRTKRQRSLFSISPAPAVAAAESSSSTEISGSGGATTTDQDEEEMANCLILLARGGSGATKESDDQKKFEAAAANSGAEECGGKAVGGGGGAYECKTCNKSFSSFQALGGHRASHKRPKIAAEKKSPAYGSLDVAGDHEAHRMIAVVRVNNNNYSSSSFSSSNKQKLATPSPPPIMLSSSSGSSKSRVHECSICGAEFSSGQALGGHMRRHRPASSAPPPAAMAEETVMMMLPPAPPPEKKMKTNSTLMSTLDLNLPAPAEDEFVQSSPLPSPSPAPAFPAALPLVDCHY